MKHLHRWIAVTVFLFSSTLLVAQQQTAALSGRVTDGSGAVVPGATVMVQSLARGIKQTVQADANGNYLFPQLPPDDGYEIHVTHTGFKETVRKGLVLQVAQTARVDLSVSLGEVSEEVTVTGAAPLIDAQTSSLGQVITGNTVESLPLNGRSSFRLVALTPGVTFSRSAYGQFGDVAVNTTWDTNFSINGGRLQGNEVLIDGVPSSVGFFNQITTLPSVDDTQEFKVESNNMPATYGRYSGGVVNVSTKAGTNSLHGSVFEFLRNSWFDANEWFNKRNGLPLPPFKMNQFGGTLGGRLFRDHTFYFLDYQGTRRIKGSPYTATVPTAAQRSGDFSGVSNIYNPFTTTGTTRTWFPNNKINVPLDPVALKILDYYPLPNRSGILNNFVAAESVRLSQDQFSVRVDQQLTDKWRMFGRYAWSSTDLTQPNQTKNIADAAGAVGTTKLTNQSFAFDNTYTFSPSLLLTVDYGFARWYQIRQTLSYGFDNSTLGFPASFTSQIGIKMFPAITIGGYMGRANQSYLNNGNDSHAIIANLTKIAGRHTLIAGVDGRMHRINYFNVANSGGAFNFAIAQTQGPTATSTTDCRNDANNTTADKTNPNVLCGNAFASFLLGAGSGGSAPLGAGVSLQDFYGAVYFQDNWRVSNHLTFNLGIRYDGETAYTDRHNRLNFFDTTVASPAANTSFPGLKGGLVFAGVNGTPRTVYTRLHNNIAPRVGLAFNPNPQTVFRGGFGIAYAPLEVSDNAVGYSPSLGYASSTAWNTSNNNGLNPANLLSNPFPQGLVQPTGNSLGASTQLGQDISVWNSNPATPTSYQWNGDVQQQFKGDFLLDLGYSGSRGLYLTGPFGLNQIDPKYLALGNSLNDQVANPFQPYVSIGTLANATVARSQLLKPYPQFTSVAEINRTWGSSIYHSAQIKVVRRPVHGISMLASYTWSKLISNVNGQLASIGSTDSTGVQNNYDLRAERAVSEMDIPHNLVVNTTVPLPFGRGEKYGANINRALDLLVGGWKLNGIFTAQSGPPLSITAASTLAANRPDPVAGVDPVIHGNRSNIDRVKAWFNKAAFKNPAAYNFGTMRRTFTTVRAPGIVNLDASLSKNFQIVKKASAEFRFEAFNVTNTPHFAPPVVGINNAQVGQITSTLLSPPPRELQVALKIKF